MEGNGLIMHSNPAGTKKVYLTSICAAKTAAQQPIAVGKRPAFFQQRRMPAANARRPARGEPAAFRIAGNVITASVTYGT